MTGQAGEVRYTRSGAEFRIVPVQVETAGHDESTWWRGCADCGTSVQGGEEGLAGHRRRVHEDELLIKP